MLTKEDCEKSLHLFPDEPHTYILLGKALYELEAFHECIDVMEYGFELLEDSGSSPSSFDEVYLTKAQAAVNMPESNQTKPLMGKHARHAIPKLPPPRFVSREEAIQTTGHVPSLPSNWPVQAFGETSLKLGLERIVVFGEGPMGVKLNRGPDGVVRVLSTSQSYERQILEGEIYAGDVVREMANVDLRRPLTNIMWGDTVALIRMSPRPITLVVAKELSEPPKGTAMEMTKAATEDIQQSVDVPERYSTNTRNNKHGVSGGGAYQRRLAEREAKLSSYPSRSSSEEPVALQAATIDASHPPDSSTFPDTIDLDVGDKIIQSSEKYEVECDQTIVSPGENDPEVVLQSHGHPDERNDASSVNDNDDSESNLEQALVKIENDTLQQSGDSSSFDVGDDVQRSEVAEILPPTSTENIIDNEASDVIDQSESVSEDLAEQKIRDAHNSIENEQLGGKVIFGDDVDCRWNNQTWCTAADGRSILFVGEVCRLTLQIGLMLTRVKSELRTLAIFSNPDLILLLRDANSSELKYYKEERDVPLKIVEAVIDAQTLKLRLSNTTTPTSVTDLQLFQQGKLRTVLNRDDSFDRRACIELITPQKTFVLSIPNAAKRNKSEVFLNISAIEVCITQLLCTIHGKVDEGLTQESYLQIILGTLHSHVVVGNETEVEYALKAIAGKERDLIDLYDEDGKAALHYACSKRSTDVVKLLVASSADVTLPTKVGKNTPCHLSAEMLDDMSISILLSSKFKRPDPSALNEKGETPMFVACVRGRSVGTVRDPFALGRCLLILKSWGGNFIRPDSIHLKEHAVSIIAREWRALELSVTLSHCELSEGIFSGSLGGEYGYPLHIAILALHKFITGDSPIDIKTHDNNLKYTGFQRAENSAVLIYGGDDDEPPFPRYDLFSELPSLKNINFVFYFFFILKNSSGAT